jgi:hypothetical protein
VLCIPCGKPHEVTKWRWFHLLQLLPLLSQIRRGRHRKSGFESPFWNECEPSRIYDLPRNLNRNSTFQFLVKTGSLNVLTTAKLVDFLLILKWINQDISNVFYYANSCESMLLRGERNPQSIVHRSCPKLVF